MYKPADWYWIVGGSTSQVYASARAAYVDLTDATYEAWLQGNVPSRIDTDANLQVVLFKAGVLGINLTSTSTSSLNGLFPTDPAAQAKVSGTATYVALNGVFPGGGTTMPWKDASGTMHDFPSVASFKAFATAFADYVAAISTYADSGGTVGAVPSNQITIP